MKGQSVLLVEASPLFRTALTSVLHRLGLSVTPLSLVDLEGRQMRRPLLILFDVATFPGGLVELEEAAGICSRIGPVLLLGREDRLEEILAGLKAGAVGFVKQTASARDLMNGIRAVASGRAYCDCDIFRRIMKFLPGITLPKETRLTKRETEVLNYLTLGRSNKEIAQSLALSEQSIKVHVSNLFRKTGTSNRSSLALFAVAHGISGAL